MRQTFVGKILILVLIYPIQTLFYTKLKLKLTRYLKRDHQTKHYHITQYKIHMYLSEVHKLISNVFLCDKHVTKRRWLSSGL
jgi:hypothetical protein